MFEMRYGFFLMKDVEGLCEMMITLSYLMKED
jgi:hypothetical protein